MEVRSGVICPEVEGKWTYVSTAHFVGVILLVKNCRYFGCWTGVRGQDSDIERSWKCWCQM